MQLTRWTIVLALPLAAAALARDGSAVAVVSDVQGAARVGAGAEPRALTLLAELRAGDTVRIDAGARVVVAFLPAGDVYELGAGRFRVGTRAIEPADPKNPPRKRALAPPLKALRVQPQGLSQGAVVMRGGAPAERVVLIRPSHVVDARGDLVFEWKPVGAGPYRFLLVDEQGRRLHEAGVDAPRYVLPPEVRLDEGRPYVWSVSARNARGVASESAAEFRLLPAAQRAALDAARPAAQADFTERIVYALALEQHGLQEEAQRYWDVLAAERPGAVANTRGR
jgi:hypothetical protein